MTVGGGGLISIVWLLTSLVFVLPYQHLAIIFLGIILTIFIDAQEFPEEPVLEINWVNYPQNLKNFLHFVCLY